MGTQRDEIMSLITQGFPIGILWCNTIECLPLNVFNKNTIEIWGYVSCNQWNQRSIHSLKKECVILLLPRHSVTWHCIIKILKSYLSIFLSNKNNKQLDCFELMISFKSTCLNQIVPKNNVAVTNTKIYGEIKRHGSKIQ